MLSVQQHKEKCRQDNDNTFASKLQEMGTRDYFFRLMNLPGGLKSVFNLSALQQQHDRFGIYVNILSGWFGYGILGPKNLRYNSNPHLIRFSRLKLTQTRTKTTS